MPYADGVCPDFNDGAYLDQSIRDLIALRPIVVSISAVPVGLTKYNNMLKFDDLPPLRRYTSDEANVIIEQVETYQREFAGTIPMEIHFCICRMNGTSLLAVSFHLPATMDYMRRSRTVWE